MEGLHQETSDRDGNCNIIITFNLNCVCSYVECLMISGVESHNWEDLTSLKRACYNDGGFRSLVVYLHCYICLFFFPSSSFFLSELRSLFHLHSVLCQRQAVQNTKPHSTKPVSITTQ